MTGLRPYERPAAPLTAGARFIRGFTRIGTAAAVLIVLIGITTIGMLSFDAHDYHSKTIADANCVASVARTGYRFTKKQLARLSRRCGSSGQTPSYRAAVSHSYATPNCSVYSGSCSLGERHEGVARFIGLVLVLLLLRDHALQGLGYAHQLRKLDRIDVAVFRLEPDERMVAMLVTNPSRQSP